MFTYSYNEGKIHEDFRKILERRGYSYQRLNCGGVLTG